MKEELERVIQENPKEWSQLTSLQKKTFNFLFGQLMKAHPNLKIQDSPSGEGAITILKRKLLEA
jgi:Asp-tRNA(Asn)/Glu-tRNA(Gln) amidotransferase B subunit